MTAARTEGQARDDWREVQGIRVYARVEGAGRGGPPVVLVGGMGCSHLYFQTFQAVLARRLEVWAVDLPGQGKSRAPAGRYVTLREQSDFLAAWLEASGLVPAVLLGHSLGGEIGIDLAARHPHTLSHLVLCAPTGIPEYPNLAEQIYNLARNALRERPTLVWRAVRSYFMCGFSRVMALLGDQLFHDTLPLLGQVHAPVLLLAGSRDPVVRPGMVRAIQLRLPRAVFVNIKGAPHALHDSHPEVVARALMAFVGGEQAV